MASPGMAARASAARRRWRAFPAEEPGKYFLDLEGPVSLAPPAEPMTALSALEGWRPWESADEGMQRAQTVIASLSMYTRT